MKRNKKLLMFAFPGLLLLASRACGYAGRRDVLYGAVFEFIHTATLVHDDVID